MTRGSAPRLGTFSVLLALLLISAAEFASASSQTRDKAQSFSQFEALPLTRSQQNHLLVRALINGKPALLIVDTGSPGTVIASNRSEHFGVSGAPAAMNWPAQVTVNGALNKVAIARHIQLEALDLVDVPVIVADMSGVRRAARTVHDPEADGILGIDVLLATKAVLDCQEQVLFLNKTPDRPGRLPGFNARGFSRVRIHVSEGLNSYVDSSINGVRTQLMIDTGAFATVLHRSFVNQMKIPVHGTRYQSSAINFSGGRVYVARIRKLSIGLVKIDGNEVGVMNLENVLSDEQGSPPVVGLLGAEILRSHHGIVDFGTRTLYLKRQSGR